MKGLLFLILAATTLAMPASEIFADNHQRPDPGGAVVAPTPGAADGSDPAWWQVGGRSAPSGGSVSLIDPLGGKSVTQFFMDIISVLLVFVTPIIVLAYIFAGFKYVTSRGNPEEIKKATTWILYISIGAVLALGAFIILEVIQGTVDAFRT